MLTPGCACLLWSHLAAWHRQQPGHRALWDCHSMGQHSALRLLEGEGPFLLYLAQHKSTHPLIPVAFRKPWSCSHLGDVGGGGGGECFCSGTEYAGEHLLASGAARDLRDTSNVVRGHPGVCSGDIPEPSAPGEPQPSPQPARTSLWDVPPQPSREGRAQQGKKAMSCASNCTKGLGGQGEVSTGTQAHSSCRGPLQWVEGLMAAFGFSLPTLRTTLAQSSQAASVSVHPTLHANGREGWEGRLGRMHWYPSPSAALPAAQRMSLGQHLVFGQAGLHQNEGVE